MFYFFPPLKKSREVVQGSEGAYDPTVMPLVNAWGFGPKKVETYGQDILDVVQKAL